MKPVISTVVAVLFVTILFAFPAFASTIHVPSDQPTIQAGIDAAMDGDTVLVASGTYIECLNFAGKAITVQSEEGADVTVVDGNQSGSVVTFDSYRDKAEDAVLKGFTITNGTGGIYCLHSNPTITKCKIFGNTIEWSSGGGIYCESASPTITNCTIFENSTEYRNGGGIYCKSASPTITNCTIYDNRADTGGGGIYCCDASSPKITHCTIADNSAYTGGGICSYNRSFPRVTNCIIWSNVAQFGWQIYVYESSFAAVSYTDVKDGWPGIGNIAADPLFVGGEDYHLTSGSPCIDAGIFSGVFTDRDGHMRPQGAGFDMGSDEYGSQPCPPARIVPTPRVPAAFFLVPVLAFVILSRRFFDRVR